MISFQNPGLIDPRGITTLGVSVKPGENPIGFFGTGLKYAIAIVLRKRGRVTIWRGLEPLRFGWQRERFRGQWIEPVTMNDRELGFTTDLGKTWEAWQAFREFYCNAKDEGGRCEAGEIQPAEGITTIHVGLPELEACLAQIDAYFLPDRAPRYSDGAVEFHAASSPYLYYRTIRVGQSGDEPFLFTPNINDRLDLTEDRTLKSPWEALRLVALSVLHSDNARFLEEWLTAPKGYAEHDLDLDWSATPSDTFMEVAYRIASDPSRTKNRTLLAVLDKHTTLPEVIECEMLPVEAQNMAAAVAFCRALTYPVDEYPITVVESLGEGILGRADRRARRVFIARRAIQAGDMTLASTLIEEWAHIKHSLDDRTRAMQDWLLDQVTRLGQAYLAEAKR